MFSHNAQNAAHWIPVEKREEPTGDKDKSMMKLQRCKRTVRLAMLSLLGVSISLLAQAPTSKSDADQIAGLLAGLSNHTKAPADVLDPTLSGPERDKNLGHFSTGSYELSIVPNDGAPTITGDSASVPVRVHYKAEDGNSLDASATAQFVRRNGIWYFASFDFMKWPAFLIVVLVVGLLVAISYAATVLVLWSRLTKHGVVGGANMVKMFVPFCWPSLFRQTR